MKRSVFTRMDSPVGELVLVGVVDGEGLELRGVYFGDAAHARGAIPEGVESDAPAFHDVVEQLRDYFAGKRTSFEVAACAHGTAFQRAVWHALAEIPYGTTMTYADIARAIGRPRAVRAVGAANGKNPLSIVVPCHRVVGGDGSLTGYAGGLAAKKALLALERRTSTAAAM
jgi:methylated-DNA-[protein]-cysteine S-methyltransferase